LNPLSRAFWNYINTDLESVEGRTIWLCISWHKVNYLSERSYKSLRQDLRHCTLVEEVFKVCNNRNGKEEAKKGRRWEKMTQLLAPLRLFKGSQGPWRYKANLQ
jgi:hypothetical protein